MPKTVAYLRVSTAHQDTEKNKAEILTFANDKKYGCSLPNLHNWLNKNEVEISK